MLRTQEPSQSQYSSKMPLTERYNNPVVNKIILDTSMALAVYAQMAPSQPVEHSRNVYVIRSTHRLQLKRNLKKQPL